MPITEGRANRSSIGVDTSEYCRRVEASWGYLGARVKEQRFGVVGAVLSGLSWQASAILAPLLVKYAIDSGITPHDKTHLFIAAAGIIALGIVESVAGALRHYFAIRNRGRGQASVRDGIFHHVLALDARFHDRVGAGELMSRASNDAELVARMLDAVGHTIGYVLTIFGVCIVLLVLDPILALVVLVPLPFIAFGFWRYSSRYAEKTRLLQEELAAATTLVEETVAGVRIVKGLGAGAALSARFRRQSDRVVQRGLEVANVDAVFLPFLEVLPLIAILAVLWLGSRSAIKGEITVGTLVAFTTYVSMLVWPMRVIGQRVGTLQQAVAAARRVVEVLHAQPAVVEGAGASPKQLRGHVRLDDVRFAYEPGRPVLDGLTIEIEPGTSLALVGETGAGKSTVAALLARFYDVDGGFVTIDGVDVRDLRLDDLRRSVATVFSETFLFTDTVRANIAYARPGASDDEIERAMRLAGAHDFVRRLPDGYDTMLGERGLSLSGGQRQRLAIARAIVADPAVLILDDATSAVDATKEHEIRSALGEVMHGRTTLVIAHRAATIALADRVAVIESGRVVEEGTHTELSRRSARYRSLLALEVAA
jgi:ATP-binding cassette subfamily B protein